MSGAICQINRKTEVDKANQLAYFTKNQSHGRGTIMLTRWQLADRLRAWMGYRFPPLGRRAFDAFYRSAPAEQEVELFPCLRVDLNLRDATQKVTYWQGVRFEHPAARILAGWIREGSVFFDIGANYGFFSYWMLTQKKPVDVYAFDPLPENAARMERARRRNGLERRFSVAGCALGDDETTRGLHTGGDDTGHSTLGNHPELKGQTVDVPVVTFDDWLARAGLRLPFAPTWIAKIDVEGFECHVLRGMRRTLHAHAFAGLMIEINPYTLNFFGKRPVDVFTLLEEAGYVSPERQFLEQTGGEICFNAYFTLSGR